MRLFALLICIIIETLALGALGGRTLSANLWWDVLDDATRAKRR